MEHLPLTDAIHNRSLAWDMADAEDAIRDPAHVVARSMGHSTLRAVFTTEQLADLEEDANFASDEVRLAYERTVFALQACPGHGPPGQPLRQMSIGLPQNTCVD